MTLFTNSSMDAVIVVLVALVVFKIVFFSKKENKNLNIIAVGTIFLLLSGILPGNALGSVLTGQQGFFTPVLQVLYIIGFVVVLIGNIKMIIELWK